MWLRFGLGVTRLMFLHLVLNRAVGAVCAGAVTAHRPVGILADPNLVTADAALDARTLDFFPVAGARLCAAWRAFQRGRRHDRPNRGQGPCPPQPNRNES